MRLRILISLARWAASSGVRAEDPAFPGFLAERGERFFNATHGGDWSCATAIAVTGKAIQALAPAANPTRFANPAKAEKWFRRNCNDVLSRPYTAAGPRGTTPRARAGDGRLRSRRASLESAPHARAPRGRRAADPDGRMRPGSGRTRCPRGARVRRARAARDVRARRRRVGGHPWRRDPAPRSATESRRQRHSLRACGWTRPGVASCRRRHVRAARRGRRARACSLGSCSRLRPLLPRFADERERGRARPVDRKADRRAARRRAFSEAPARRGLEVRVRFAAVAAPG
jgi:hypothetical protein